MPAPRPHITDSPWYWILVFSLMALAALAAISGKYGRRQANIERQYQARERVAEKLASENNPPDATRIDDEEDRRAFATSDNRLIPIWPLAVLLGLIALLSLVMLVRATRASRPVHGPDDSPTSS